jgi:hypothetical protein
MGMDFDSAHNQIVLFGGTSNAGVTLGDTWLWNGTMWTSPEIPGPCARHSTRMVFRVADGKMVLFGGIAGVGCQVAPESALPDTWTWNGTTWNQENPAPPIPPARHSQGMAYHGPTQTVVMFGGNMCPGVCGDTWWWNGTNWTPCPLADCPVGTPSARTSPAMAFHQNRNRTIMYGGSGPPLLSDTWQWNGTFWSQVTNVGAPQARTTHRMAYDSNRKAIVMFGGCTGNCGSPNPTLINETWTLDGGAWMQWSVPLRRKSPEGARTQSGRGRLGWGAAAAILLGALAGAGLSSGASASSQLADAACRQWRVAPVPDLPNIALTGVAGTSSTDVWAVGYNGLIVPSPPTALHWDGSAWTEVSQPVPSGYLYDVAAISPSDAWAVGWYGPILPLIQHWDGEAWRRVTTPIPGSYHYLLGVSPVSSTDVWAVGFYTPDQGLSPALTMHWDGARWRVVRAPDGVFYGVSALSSDDVWAVGYEVPAPFTAKPLIQHWDGARWSVVPEAPPPFGDQNFLHGVAAVSPNDVWAVGYYGFADEPFRPLIEHWDGTAWTLVDPPAMVGQNTLYAVSASSSTDVWAVGRRDTSQNDWQPLTLHWDGTSWKAMRPPTLGLNAVLHAVSSISATDVRAAGVYTDDEGHLNPLLEHSRGCPPSTLGN